MKFFEKLKDAFSKAGSSFRAKDRAFGGGSDIVATGNGRAAVYVQTKIEDPAEHIRKLSAVRKPYANVPPHD